MLSISDTRSNETCPRPFNAAQYVLSSGGAPDDKIALSVMSASRSERWSYGRLRTEVARTAASLRSQGLGPGDILLLRLGHSPFFPLSFLGAIWAGIHPVPTSDQLTTSEVTRVASALAPQATLFDEEVALPENPRRLIPASRIIGRNAPPIPPEMGDPDRLGYILCTSGTSGVPRLVHHAHRAIWARRYMKEGWTDLRPSDRLLHSGAFNWSYTLGTGLLDPWSVGATALIMSKGLGPDMMPLLAKRHDATIIAAVPGVFRKLTKTDLPSLPRLRHALSAGEKLPATLRKRWKDLTGTEVHEAFGQTECSTFISGSPTRPAPRDTLGYPQRGRAVAIIHNSAPVEIGTPGEIAVCDDDPGLCLDHANRGEGWVGTGDMGQMREDGAITYLGRVDDILTAGGYRVAPIEIEHAFEDYADILASAAVDHRISEDTTVIALFYTSKGDIAESDLVRHAAGRLAAYKIPRFYKRVASLPIGANGKLLRRELRAAKDAGS